jgi:hypothetical protein
MTPLTKEQQYKILSGLSAGDAFEYGALFDFGTPEPIVWTCLSVDRAPTDKVVTLAAHTFGVFLRTAVAVLPDGDQSVVWEGQ